MSVGAYFAAIGKKQIQNLLDDPFSMGEFLDKSPEDGGPRATQTVEQAWDVVRSLLPESIGDDFIEESDVGEFGLFHMPAAEVPGAATLLAGRDMEALAQAFSNEPDGELYWSEVWGNNPDELTGYFKDIAAFFAEAASRGDAVLFIIQ